MRGSVECLYIFLAGQPTLFRDEWLFNPSGGLLALRRSLTPLQIKPLVHINHPRTFGVSVSATGVFSHNFLHYLLNARAPVFGRWVSKLFDRNSPLLWGRCLLLIPITSQTRESSEKELSHTCRDVYTIVQQRKEREKKLAGQQPSN